MRTSVRFFVFEEGGEYFATGVDVAAMGEGASVIDAVHGLKEALLALAAGCSGREQTFTQVPPGLFDRIHAALVSGGAVREEDWRATDFEGTPVAAGELELTGHLWHFESLSCRKGQGSRWYRRVFSTPSSMTASMTR